MLLLVSPNSPLLGEVGSRPGVRLNEADRFFEWRFRKLSPPAPEPVRRWDGEGDGVGDPSRLSFLSLREKILPKMFFFWPEAPCVKVGRESDNSVVYSPGVVGLAASGMGVILISGGSLTCPAWLP